MKIMSHTLCLISGQIDEIEMYPKYNRGYSLITCNNEMQELSLSALFRICVTI